MIRQFLNPPNWFTAANLFCGFYAVAILIGGDGGAADVSRAALLVLFAAVFDMLDGRVARITGTGSEFGTQLDSLADVVSFGLAPALLAWTWGLAETGVVGLAFAFGFVVCGAFRLARYNLSATGEAHPESTGLTITLAGVTLSLLVAAYARAGRDPWGPWNLALLMGLLSTLMVSRVRYRTFKTLRFSPVTIALLALFGGICIVVGTRWNVTAVFLVMALTYVMSGPLEGIVRLGLRRRPAGVAPPPDDPEDAPEE